MSIYSILVKTIDGEETTLKKYEGKYILIVNVASECGFTVQYEGLEDLYKKYKHKNFIVLGFPCDQFGHQEPGSEKEIESFCKIKFGVTFPLFSKIKVNGPDTHPLYVYLKKAAKGILGTQAIKWNFTKFLVDLKGNVLKRYSSQTKPEAIDKELEKLLNL
ncbi:glutathione peroxidase [Candidatus Nomurabacteria bacterium]|nr:glutathione peroxidase [Candidatus Nomurabacteria bacterium]